MTRIDFYQLNPSRRTEDVVCRLCEKAYSQQQHVLVLTRDAEQSERIDQMLWVYEDDSFIPHDLDEVDGMKTPVLIQNNPASTGHREILINLTTNIPEFFPQFERVLELVTEDNRTEAREGVAWEQGFVRDYRALDAQITANGRIQIALPQAARQAAQESSAVRAVPHRTTPAKRIVRL